MANGDILKVKEIADLNIHAIHNFLANKADRADTDREIRNQQTGTITL